MPPNGFRKHRAMTAMTLMNVVGSQSIASLS
jgi:hypothetical protein